MAAQNNVRFDNETLFEPIFGTLIAREKVPPEGAPLRKRFLLMEGVDQSGEEAFLRFFFAVPSLLPRKTLTKKSVV